MLVELNRFDEAEAAFIRIAWFGKTEFDPMTLNNINNGVRSTLHSNRESNRGSQAMDSKLSALKKSTRSGLMKSITSQKTSGLYEDE